jgi:hypothetical protein
MYEEADSIFDRKRRLCLRRAIQHAKNRKLFPAANGVARRLFNELLTICESQVLIYLRLQL